VSKNADVVGNASESTPNRRASGTLHLDRSRSRAPTSAGFLNRSMPHLSRAVSLLLVSAIVRVPITDPGDYTLKWLAAAKCANCIPRSCGVLSVSILEEGGRLGLKCLLLSHFRVGDNSEVNRRPGYNRLPSLSLQRFISSLLGNDLSSTLRAVSTPAMGSPRGSRMPI
jgi:hypothetical protein